MHDPFIRKAGVSFLLLLMLATVQIPLPVHADSLNVSPLSPSTGVTITSGPVILAVRYTNGSTVVPGIQTDFYVQAPGSTTPTWVANASSDSLGAAYLPYTPPSPGSYQWSVKYYPWHNSTYMYSLSWTFNWGTPATTITQTSYSTVTGTTTQWSTTAYTHTVGVVTEYSYLYETVTSPTTAYRTQTVSTTRTMSSQTTIMKTSTAFKTTETTPITYHQTQSTTLTETLYGTIRVTQYVYIDSYVSGQVIESATIHEIPSGSEGSVHFSKSDQHKIETITIGVISNVTNVKIAIGTDPDHPSLGTNTNEYESFQIAATNLPDQDIKSTTIDFKVDTNWLSNNQIPQDKVSLYRLENGEWRELQTSLQKTDETYAYYEAVSPGLSSFAIAGQSTLFFQIPEVGPIANSYVMILALMVLTIVGVYGAIRIKRARSRSKKDGNGSDPTLADTSSDPQIEAKLLEYITKHGGSISLSKAAEDLGVPPVTLKEAIGHLKNGGKLAPA